MTIPLMQLQKEVRSGDFTVAYEDGKELSPTDKKTVDAFLVQPDPEFGTFDDWVSAYLADFVEIGCVGLAPLVDGVGKARGLRLVDASLLIPVRTEGGMLPKTPDIAYVLYTEGQQWRVFSRDELTYRKLFSRTWTPFGVGVVELVLSLAMLSFNRGNWYTKQYSGSELPPGMITLPEGWDAEAIKLFEKNFWAIYAAAKNGRKLVFAPDKTKYTEMRTSPEWKYEFDEFIMRMASWAIGIAATPIVKNATLGQGSEGLEKVSVASGAWFYGTSVAKSLTEYIQNERTGTTTLGAPIKLGLGLKRVVVSYSPNNYKSPGAELSEALDLFDRTAITTDELRSLRGWPANKKIQGRPMPSPNQPAVKPTEPPSSKDNESEDPEASLVYRFAARKAAKRRKRSSQDVQLLKAQGYVLFDRIYKRKVKSHVPQMIQWFEHAQKTSSSDDGTEFEFTEQELKDIKSWLKSGVRLGGRGVLMEEELLAFVESRSGELLTRGGSQYVLATLQSELKTLLEGAVSEGWTVGELREGLDQFMVDEVPSRALTIARTEVGNVFNGGSLSAMEKLGVTHVMVLDGAGCEACRMADGQIWTIAEAKERLLEHPDCERDFVEVEEEDLV